LSLSTLPRDSVVSHPFSTTLWSCFSSVLSKRCHSWEILIVWLRAGPLNRLSPCLIWAFNLSLLTVTK
jgi:hypothetical protein